MDIQLTTEPFESLINQGESVDFRLDEDRWRSLRVGDHITFWEDFSGWDTQPSPSARRVKTELVDVFRARSFVELIDSLPPEFSRNASRDAVISELRQWWTPEVEKKIGVLGLRVKVIPS